MSGFRAFKRSYDTGSFELIRTVTVGALPDGRREAIEQIQEQSEGVLDALVPCAGLSGLPNRPGSLLVSLNYFGTIELLEGLRDGEIETHCVDTSEPSPLARGALAIGPYGFLDDAGLHVAENGAARRSERLTDVGSGALAHWSLDPASDARTLATGDEGPTMAGYTIAQWTVAASSAREEAAR